jgi:hypothetical protein
LLLDNYRSSRCQKGLFHDAVKLGSLAGRRMAPQRYLIAAKF